MREGQLHGARILHEEGMEMSRAVCNSPKTRDIARFWNTTPIFSIFSYIARTLRQVAAKRCPNKSFIFNTKRLF
jgi:hypothetical protein